MNYTFKGNFGTLELVVDDNGTASGTYQKGGTLSGTYKDGEFEGEWENKEMEGLLKFTVSEGNLTGRWKKGKDAGPMRGNWLGEQIGSQTQEVKKEKEYPMIQRDWGIAESIAVLMRHMMLTDDKVDESEMVHMQNALDYYTSVNVSVREVWDSVDDTMLFYHKAKLTGRVVMGCTYYLAEKLNEEQKLKLFNILIQMVTSDKELHYREYANLEIITSVIVPSMDFDNVEQTLTEYGVTILKE
ncbi:TerB family tellurite resistance protein [Flavobacteriaceae bacterium]|nr:TerB family tellurite resistance protein [Flavobacteriaceae bacterium]